MIYFKLSVLKLVRSALFAVFIFIWVCIFNTCNKMIDLIRVVETFFTFSTL